MLVPILAILVVLVLLGLLIRAQRRKPVLQYLFFCRFPLLTALFLLALVPISLGPASSLLENLYVLTTFGGIVLVSFLAVLDAWVVVLTAGTILHYGPRRFEVPASPLPGWVKRFRFILGLILALPVIGAVVALSSGPLGWRLLAAGLGLFGAAVALLLATALQALLERPEEETGRMLLPTGVRPFQSLTRLDPMGRLLGGGGVRKAAAGTGYSEPAIGRLGTGHLMAMAFLLVTLAAYVLGYLLLDPAGTTLPALGYLLVLVLLAGWTLPGISFFLDRYRVPVSLALTLLIVAASFLFNNGHLYSTLPREAGEANGEGLTLAQAFLAAEEYHGDPGGPTVVVAASGGGITASLWAARVLTGLQEAVGEPFPKALRLVSAVSGGSVGSLFYLDRFRLEGPPPPEALKGILDAAGGSSLDAVGWGFAYPDLWRLTVGFLPRDRTLDRGWAQGETWRRRLQKPEATLGDWREGHRDGWLPAAIFNSTVINTGQLFWLTGLSVEENHFLSFLETYPTADLPVVTAARLSATFPWVSPITQALLPDGRLPDRSFQLADGGYYDNFGVVSVIRWLESLRDQPGLEVEGRRLLLVLIRAFPPEDPDAGLQARADQGWFYETVGPIFGLLNVRTSTQTDRDQLEMEFLLKLLQAYGVEAEVAHFVLTAEAPLSWKLTGAQRRAILDGWQEPEVQEAVETVRAFLGQAP